MPDFLPSEGEIRAKVRQHPVVIVALPSRNWMIVWLVAAVLGYLWPNPLAWAFALIFLGMIAVRYRKWFHERIYLTDKRLVRIEGLPETTDIEAWLRLDRISGLRFEQSWWGSRFGWATIVLEAPGSHPATHKLETISSPQYFYGVLRKLVLDGPSSPDPDDTGEGRDYATAPLPRVTPPPPYLPRDDEAPFWHRPGH